MQTKLDYPRIRFRPETTSLAGSEAEDALRSSLVDNLEYPCLMHVLIASSDSSLKAVGRISTQEEIDAA